MNERKKPSRPLSPWYLVLAAAVFLLQALPGLWGNSLTNDEPMEISNGYFYLTAGDVTSHHRHPPFGVGLQAFPLLFLGLGSPSEAGDALDRAHRFFFVENLSRLDAMTVWPRLLSLLLGLGLGGLLYRMVRHGDRIVAVSTLSLWAFEPTLLAFSGLALADIPLSFFFLATLAAFEVAQKRGGPGPSFLTGVLAGAAVTTKFSGLGLIPVLLILEAWQWRKGTETSSRILGRWAWGAAGAFLWVGSVYGRGWEGGVLFPYQAFWAGLMDMAQYGDHPVYFMGRVGREDHWAYFPVAFLLKTPIPFLALLVFGGCLLALRRISLPVAHWLPGILFFLMILPTQNLGIRYLLPAYPFLILVAASGAGWLWRKGGLGAKGTWYRAGLLGMGALQLVSVAASFPGHLSYFNEAAGIRPKWYWLADSNLDIGQDLKRLGRFSAEREWGTVTLAYLGGVDPAVYGLDWVPWRAGDVRGPRPDRVYLVNISLFQLAPVFYPGTRVIADSWIANRPPTGKVGDSWYYFEIPGEPMPADPQDPILPSVPFQQYRGYTAFPPAGSKGDAGQN